MRVDLHLNTSYFRCPPLLPRNLPEFFLLKPFMLFRLESYLVYSLAYAEDLDEDHDGMVTEEEVLNYLESVVDEIEMKLGHSHRCQTSTPPVFILLRGPDGVPRQTPRHYRRGCSTSPVSSRSWQRATSAPFMFMLTCVPL